MRTFSAKLAAGLGSDDGADRVSQIRHVALLLACGAAYLLQEPLHVGPGALWTVGVAAFLNFVAFVASGRRSSAELVRRTSPLFGLAVWSTLIHFTGGSSSPFVAGLALEIVLSATTLGPAGVLLVGTGAAIAALVVARPSPGGTFLLPLLHAGVLLVTGGVTAVLVGRWRRERGAVEARQRELQDRLAALERDLREAREFGRMGEHVARLAHGLKNAVHSLRGFASLIGRRRGPAPSATDEALEGLRLAIDRLEALARTTLGGGAAQEDRGPPLVSDDLGALVELECREIEIAYPGVRCSTSLDDGWVPLSISRDSLRDVIQALLQNAAEAMDGEGEVRLSSRAEGGELRLEVRDHGRGIPQEAREEVFRPGFTTKPGGSGYGLFLARRLVEAHGGELRGESAPGGGAVFRLRLRAAGGER